MAQIRNVYNDEDLTHTPTHPPNDITSSYFDAKVDPQNQLHLQQREQFEDINKTYQNVFRENFQEYSSRSGNIKFDVNFETALPPLTKRRLPVYDSDNLRLLQEKFDELESLGVLAKPEDLGVTVVHTSLSSLVKKPKGGHRPVTSFVELNRFIKPLPTRLTPPHEALLIEVYYRFRSKTFLFLNRS